MSDRRTFVNNVSISSALKGSSKTSIYFDIKHGLPGVTVNMLPLYICLGNRELWEQPFQACAVDADCVRPDGQNSVISIVISK